MISRPPEPAPLRFASAAGSATGPRSAGVPTSDDIEFDEPPELAFFCPVCVEREFDTQPRPNSLDRGRARH
jgi:hypothetical protein